MSVLARRIVKAKQARPLTMRFGTVAQVSPLKVSIDGVACPVKAHDHVSTLSVGDTVSLLVQGSDVLVTGRVA